MKFKNIVPTLLIAVLFLTIGAAVNQQTSIYIQDSDPAVTKLKVRSATQTNPWLEFSTDSGLLFSVPANGILAASNLPIQTGIATTAADGTCTQTFTLAFSAVPKVVSSPNTNNVLTNAISSITTSNFVLTLGVASATANWIAVGP